MGEDWGEDGVKIGVCGYDWGNDGDKGVEKILVRMGKDESRSGVEVGVWVGLIWGCSWGKYRVLWWG